jgi:hypothetical protein
MSYRIVHKESGKEAVVEVKGFDRDEMIRQASEKIGEKIWTYPDITSVGFYLLTTFL